MYIQPRINLVQFSGDISAMWTPATAELLADVVLHDVLFKVHSAQGRCQEWTEVDTSSPLLPESICETDADTVRKGSRWVL